MLLVGPKVLDWGMGVTSLGTPFYILVNILSMGVHTYTHTYTISWDTHTHTHPHMCIYTLVFYIYFSIY